MLGDIDKGVDSKIEVTADYSVLLPAVTITGYSFRISPGGEPQLWIDTTAIGAANNVLTFFVHGGVAGVQYTVKVIAVLGDAEIRTDTLNVNVLGDNCACNSGVTSPPTDSAVSGDGSIIVNTAPRFFVSGVAPIGANLLDRWYNTATGNVYDYISNGVTTQWVLAGSGGSGGASNVIRSINPIYPDGVTTTFTLTSVDATPVNIAGANYLFVSVDGVWQDPTNQYTATANMITFSQAPTADATIFMLWFGPPTS